MKGIASLDRPESARELLEHDHTRLEALFESLMEALRVDARDDVRPLWTELEESLLGHMLAEERWVLPAFADVDPTEAAALQHEHVDLRGRLEDLGTGVQLHAIAEPVAAGFIQALRAHAQRENRLLYRWLETHETGLAGRDRIL